MSNVSKIDFSESHKGSGNIRLFENHLNRGGKYYAKFERRTINDDTIVARIGKRGVGIEDLAVKEIICLYKQEVLEALRNGEAVNIMDLGTLHVCATGTVDSQSDATSGIALEARFTVSELTNKAVSLLKITGVSVVDRSPQIEDVVDLYTGSHSSDLSSDEREEQVPLELSDGKSVMLTGKQLKIAGKDGGVYLCPLNDEGAAEADLSKCVRVQPDKITRNRTGEIEFFLPPEAGTGSLYKILVKTDYLSKDKHKKSFSTALSCPVRIVSA